MSVNPAVSLAATRAPKRRRRIDPAVTPAGVVGHGADGPERGHLSTLLQVIRLWRSRAVRNAPRNSASTSGGCFDNCSGRVGWRARSSRCSATSASQGDYASLRDCSFVIESIIEDLATKKQVLRNVEDAVSPECLIGTNTSAIPVTHLQEDALHPERILGIHWAEPAHVTRFMEIICGDQSDPRFAEFALQLAARWGKEPTLVRRDIRGFIANRLMYALMREAFQLVESGYASCEDVDRSARNDLGWWITFAGPFRFMDLTGIPAYEKVMQDLLPDLCQSTEVPHTHEAGCRIRRPRRLQRQRLLPIHAGTGKALGEDVSEIQLRDPSLSDEVSGGRSRPLTAAGGAIQMRL